MPLCSVIVIKGRQYLLGIYWVCDIGIRAAKGVYLEWSITREEEDYFSLYSSTLPFSAV